MTAPAKLARTIKNLLIECSPLIDEYTAAVCPSCRSVCCKQRHGAFTTVDRVYLDALGEKVPPHDPAWPPDSSCQFLGPSGCAKPRWQRAWKCTWFYCSPLLEALASGPTHKARKLTFLQQELIRLYDEFGSTALSADTTPISED